MNFDALLAQARDLLQRQGRVSYRALKVRFDLDAAYLDAPKDELIYPQHVALDEEDRVLVWTGEAGITENPPASPPDRSRQTPLSIQSYHGVLAGNVHTCSLKTRMATVRKLLFGLRKQHWRGTGASCRISQLQTCRSMRGVRKRVCLEVKCPCCFSRPNRV
jgi:hypothetical protein